MQQSGRLHILQLQTRLCHNFIGFILGIFRYMGCAKSSNVIAPVQSVIFPKGVLTVELQNAILLRDTALIMKMDPYIILKVGDQTLKSLVQKSEGANPTFHQKFSFYINSDKINTAGRCLELQVWDKNIVTDRQIGFGITDVDPIVMNRITNYVQKCHISHDMKPAGWVKIALSFKEDFRGKLLFKPITAKLTRKIGFGNMNCAVRVIIGQDVSTSKISPDTKESQPVWEQTLVLNMIKSLNKGKVQVIKVSGEDSYEVICQTQLELESYCTKSQSEHEIQLKHKDTYAGNIRFSSMLLSPEEYEKYRAIQHSEIPQAPPLSPERQSHISPQKHQASAIRESKISNPQSNHQ